MKELILVCEDLFGLEVLELIDQINLRDEKEGKEPSYRVSGYISDRMDPFGEVPSRLERLGSISGWTPRKEELFLLGISDPQSKYRTVALLEGRGARFETVRTPWTIASDLRIGEGSVISAYSIKSGIEIGRFVTVVGAMLSNQKIGDFSTVLRFTNLAGGTVGERTYIGNHAFMAVGKKVGSDCRVADGSIVVKDVKDGLCVAGVPARRVKA